MKRPILTPLPLKDAMQQLLNPRGGGVFITMSTDQWDTLLAQFYQDGAILLEVDADETPVRAFQKNLDRN